MTTTELATTKPTQFDLSPTTFAEAITFSEYLADSDLVPKNFQGKPGNCLIAMQWGNEVGMKALQSIQTIAVINGKPSLYGDAGKALLLSHGCRINEDDIEVIKKTGKGRCKITRPGHDPVERTFSLENAKTAGLLNKDGPWKTYPERQLAWRAFWFAARDAAADILRGMGGAEEALDLPKDMGEVIHAGGLGSDWSPDVLATARAAVNKGAAAYGAFWKTLPPEEQARLVKTPEHAANKADALKADSARTFDTSTEKKAASTDATGPVVTFAKVMASLVGAKTLDELGDAADWIGEVPDEVQRKELKAKYEELGSAMEAAQ